MEEVEPFRYRAMDAYKAVTAIAIKESRLKEIKAEIFNSNKLKVSLFFWEKIAELTLKLGIFISGNKSPFICRILGN